VASDPKTTLSYPRVVLKMSGEALCGQVGGQGIDAMTLKATAAELASVHATGVQIGIVVGEATFSVDCAEPAKAWTGRRAITWACSPR